MKTRRFIRYALIAWLALLLAGLLWPEHAAIPVQGASARDWNPRSFWFEPWGVSGVHKGIDIFAPVGRPVLAAVPGLVIYAGQLKQGGNVVAVLGPKWRIHYYAHLTKLDVAAGHGVGQAQIVGTVGTTGNAQGKPAHLHYSVLSLVPLPWRVSTASQGWKRMFFLDPGELLVSSSQESTR